MNSNDYQILAKNNSAQKHRYGLIVKILGVALVYFIAARLGLLLELGNTNASPVWPPSGIAFAAMLICGVEIWPGIAIGALAVNILVFYEHKVTGLFPIITTSLVMCTGNTLEAMAGYYLLKWFKAEKIINKARDFGYFFMASLLMCIISASMGTTALAVSNIAQWHTYGTIWFTWWMGDVSGIIVLTPVILSWNNFRMPRQIQVSKTLQVLMAYLVLGLYLAAVFGGYLPIGLSRAKIFFIFLILIWCAFTMNQRQASFVVIFLSAFTIWSTINQMGPFIEESQNDSFISLQVFLCIASITMMFLSTTFQERGRAESILKDANANLEKKVIERTSAIEKSRKQLETVNENLIAKTREIEKANNDLRLFAHIISHDLREPLRTITSFLQLFEEKSPDNLDSEAREYIDYAINGAKRMNALIEDLLTYSRVEHNSPNVEEVDMNEVMLVVKNNLNGAIEKNKATISIGMLPMVPADFLQMVQLFQNLVANSIKYKSTQPLQIKVSAEKSEKEYTFSIADNGIGIPPEHIERIFVIFQRLHTYDKYEGTGVGLAICRKIVDGHGGKIWAEPNPGGGTIFKFTMPLEN